MDEFLLFRNLHNAMLQNVLHSPMSFFDTTPLGRIVNRFAKDMYTVDETIPTTSSQFLMTALEVLAIIIAISISTPIFLAAVVPLGVFYFYIQKYYGQRFVIMACYLVTCSYSGHISAAEAS